MGARLRPGDGPGLEESPRQSMAPSFKTAFW